MQDLANVTEGISILLEDSCVDYRCMPPYFHEESPLHIDGMLGLVIQGLESLKRNQGSGHFQHDLVTEIRKFITAPKNDASPLRKALDAFLLSRKTTSVGHEVIQLFLMDIISDAKIGDLLNHLVMNRIPAALSALNSPLRNELTSDAFLKLMETWILKDATQSHYCQKTCKQWFLYGWNRTTSGRSGKREIFESVKGLTPLRCLGLNCRVQR